MDFQKVAWASSPWVAVRRDIDRYSDRESKSEALFRIEQRDRFALAESAAPMLAYAIAQAEAGATVPHHGLEARDTYQPTCASARV
jgi:hypothetical protein